MSHGWVALVVGAGIVAVVLAIAWPFVSPDRGAPEAALSPIDRRRIELLERRDAAYAGLRDLEHDHRTGKVTEEDYQRERRRLRDEAAAALQALDSLDSDQLDSTAGDRPQAPREV